MRTSNPALSDKAFQMAIDYGSPTAASSMTLSGTVIKTAILLGTAVIAGAFSWNQLVNGADNAKLLMIGGAIGRGSDTGCCVLGIGLLLLVGGGDDPHPLTD